MDPVKCFSRDFLFSFRSLGVLTKKHFRRFFYIKFNTFAFKNKENLHLNFKNSVFKFKII
jgi:ribosomal protein L19E